MLVVVVALAAVPLVVSAAVVGLRSPMTVLFALYAALVPMGSAVDLPIPLPPPFDTVSSLAGLVAAVGLAIEVLVLHRGAARWSRALPCFLVFLGWAAITIGWSIDPRTTAHELVLLASVFGIYVIVAIARIDLGQLDRIATGIVAGAVLASLYGLALLATGRGTNGDLGAPRLAIIGDDPNHTAAALLLPFVIAGGRMLSGPIQRRLVHAAAAVVIFAAIFLTGSRGGLVALLAGAAALVLAGPSVRQARIVLGVLVVAGVLAVGLAPASLQARLTDPSSTGRTTIWRLGLRSCDRFCLQGSGWGTFPTVYQQEFRVAPEAGGYRSGAFRAHNIWLQALVETGIVGLAALLAAFGVALVEVLGLPRDRRGPPLAALVSLALASTLISNMTFKYFWLVLAFCALSVTARPEEDAVVAPGAATPEPTRAGGTLVAATRER
jgi:O-antigen ligase